VKPSLQTDVPGHEGTTASERRFNAEESKRRARSEIPNVLARRLFAHQKVLAAAGALGEREQRDVPGALDGHGERALVPGACSQLAARLDLAALTDVAPQAGDVLVVDVLYVVGAERAHLAARRKTATAAGASATAAEWTAATLALTTTLALRTTTETGFAGRSALIAWLLIVCHGMSTRFRLQKRLVFKDVRC
jgi:hypothetical protein